MPAEFFWRPIPESMIRWKVPCESSPASAGLELTAEALPKSAIWRAGLMREPQCFSTCLSVPGFAWLDRKDSKQASACWSVSVGGLPLEPYPRIYDSVEGSMQRSLTLTPTPAATLSVLPSGSHSALRAKRQRSLTLTPTPAATLSCSLGESLVSSPGEQAIFPGFSRPGKCDGSGGKPQLKSHVQQVGATEERCGSCRECNGMTV